MIFILLSICCNVIVSILLKLARRYEVDVKQAIAWNYSIAAALTWFFFKPELSNLRLPDLPFPVYLTLGILLPSLFVVIAGSVRYTGIVRTDVAQRLSLLIPVFAAFILFSENLSPLKFSGISIGIAAVICSIPWEIKSEKKASSFGWIYLLVVFVGMGIIDVLFKQVAVFKKVPYTSSLQIIYIIAFVVSIIFLLFLFLTKKAKFEWKHVFSGWMLGIANFGNILFYLKAHQAEASRPSLVFSAMNIGVIAAGSLVGLWLFNEKLSRLNKAGIVLAVISILVITYS
jgi:drug/metabolite transporter (DMT)-like permease